MGEATRCSLNACRPLFLRLLSTRVNFYSPKIEEVINYRISGIQCPLLSLAVFHD